LANVYDVKYQTKRIIF